MSMKYIRDCYKVPAKRGGRIKYVDSFGTSWFGRITSAKGNHLRVLVDDRVKNYRGRLLLHPTWNVEYL
jgi:hypothetical protein